MYPKKLTLIYYFLLPPIEFSSTQFSAKNLTTQRRRDNNLNYNATGPMACMTLYFLIKMDTHNLKPKTGGGGAGPSSETASRGEKQIYTNKKTKQGGGAGPSSGTASRGEKQIYTNKKTKQGG